MRVIGYLTSGYPSLEGCIKGAAAYIEGGCDMLEISVPLYNNREAPYLSDLMREAIKKYPVLDDHLCSIEKIAKENPSVQITLLLYQEVILEIGAKKLADFCAGCGIRDINSPDLRDEEAIRILRGQGIRLAGLILYEQDEERLEDAKRTDGFIYCQAFPREGQNLSPGCETPEQLIACIRSQGITNPIYCGGGIRTPGDGVRLKQAGADGFFLGTSILTIMDDTEKVVETVKSFKQAVG